MLVQILVGASISVLNIIVHALLTVSTIWTGNASSLLEMRCIHGSACW